MSTVRRDTQIAIFRPCFRESTRALADILTTAPCGRSRVIEMPITSLRIGIVDYHGDFRRIITEIVPTHHTVICVPRDAASVDVDLLINHHDATLNGRYSVPFLAIPYGTVSEHHVEHWNANPNCVGVIDMSNDLARRFPQIRPPILSFKPFYPDTPIYERPGDKVISLISSYKERFPHAYATALSLTRHVLG